MKIPSFMKLPIISKITCFLVALIITSSIGCTRVVRLDSPEYMPTYEHSNLIFQTDTLSKSRWYLLTSYNLRLEVYRDKAEKPGKFEYVGTAVLTSDENSKSISIPSETNVYLLTEYSDYVVGVMSTCKASLCLRPKAGVTYRLFFQHDAKSCKLALYDADSNERIESPCTSVLK